MRYIQLAKDALNQHAIQKHYQPKLRKYMYSADGCGDNLYRTANQALIAHNTKAIMNIVVSQNQMDKEHA